MRVAVLGANGFVGRNLSNYLCKQHHNVTRITRETLDLLDMGQVTQFLQIGQYDVILCCAATMNGTVSDVHNNLGLFMNFYHNSSLFGKFINTASGAEYDRESNIDQVPESAIFSRLPKDSYGLGQNIRSRLGHDKSNFYNLRIFNCFGLNEIKTRIFPRFLDLKDTDILEITNDRYFDYFSIQDLCTVVNSFVENDQKVKDVNCVYQQKYKISDVLNLFCETNDLTKRFKIISSSNLNYTGSGQLLKTLDLPLMGLEYGLRNYLQGYQHGSI